MGGGGFREGKGEQGLKSDRFTKKKKEDVNFKVIKLQKRGMDLRRKSKKLRWLGYRVCGVGSSRRGWWSKWGQGEKGFRS